MTNVLVENPDFDVEADHMLLPCLSLYSTEHLLLRLFSQEFVEKLQF